MIYDKIVKIRCEFFYVIAVVLTGFTGCASPPSVLPLLRVTQDALQVEANRIREDIARDRQAVDQMRMTLDSGFTADLQQQENLTALWVTEATNVYVAAREAMLSHELNLKQERLQRADNLEVAAGAAQRAMALLQQRDHMLADTFIARLWRFLNHTDHPPDPGTPAPRNLGALSP